MRTVQKIISAGFATCAFAAASMPALSWTTLGSVDAGPVAAASPDEEPAPEMVLLALVSHHLHRR